MNQFEDRKKAFEKKFEIDEELRFKVASRTSKLFGLWAAEQMGIKGADAEAYARQVVEADLEKAGHDDVIEKVEKDFQAKGISLSRHSLEREINNCHQAAREQIAGSAKG